MPLISVWTAISRAQVEVRPHQWENGAPNNASSQTKNYEIAPFILGRRRDPGFSGTARILRHKNPENGIPTQHPLRF
ncbi:hypothetical protein HPP92_028435 [Vanilla planifolia]|uniref:Uncharacterized protein n=1 Tax=Vanilla planifolia TaxID=51239 RepID=A0A835P8U4_VANPL|nr:hypothetical protein HPP92_028422 [Vanilla planifolia]KAG0447332.1 hypothetical protein HPP92_028435 [Vanilla planifolia]